MNSKEKIGHFKRLKTKYLDKGINALTEEEILELILKYGNFRKDTKQIARQLLKKYHSLVNIINVPVEELALFSGIGKFSLIPLKLIPDIAKFYTRNNIIENKISLDSPTKIIDYLFAYYKDQKKEILKLLFLNNSLNLIDELDFVGIENKVIPNIKEIVRNALKVYSTHIIIVHNHPGGSLKPSKNDIQFTEELYKILKKMDIILLDHIIISNGQYYSFAENDILGENKPL